MKMTATDMDSMSRPERSRSQWVTVLTLWSNNFIWVGIIKGLGIMLPTLQQQLTTQTWIIGWITAMVVATGGFVGK